MSAMLAPGGSPDFARRLLDATLDAVAAFDRELRFTYWNDAMAQIYGLRDDETLGRPAVEALPSLAESGELDCFRRALAGERVASKDRPYVAPRTGRTIFVESTYTPLRDDRGAVIGGIVVARDVTERKRAEEHTKETESRFLRMADSSPVLLWMSGTDALCNFFNQTWLSFTGRTLAEEAGVGWAEGVHPLDFQNCVDTYIEAFNARRPFEMEYRLRRHDGEFRWVLDRGAPRFDHDGNFAGFIGSCTDITDRKALESALQEALVRAEGASRLKSEFLANVSHELRTPLNALINVPLSTLRDFPTYSVWECAACGETFRRSGPDDEGDEVAPSAYACPDCRAPMALTRRPFYVGDSRKTVHFLERMVQSSRHLLKVVNDILDFAKIDAGRVRLFLSEVNVVDVLREVQQTMTSFAEEKNIAVTYPAPAEPVWLTADGVKVAQILLNLLSNAIKFTPSGGAVSVEIEANGGVEAPAVHFVVRDNGVGVPADKLATIFESFRQADGGHTRAHHGTGLGLAITKQLVELHGGRIWVDSDVGAGSAFHFVLPRRPADDTRPSPSDPPGRRGRVLVVDDDPADLDLARVVLEREGFEVTLADRAETALELVRRERPDCIVLDVVMPDLSGLTLLRRFKESDETSAIGVIVTTGFHSNREVVGRLGGIWLPKPWGARDLVAKVREQVAREQMRRRIDQESVAR